MATDLIDQPKAADHPAQMNRRASLGRSLALAAAALAWPGASRAQQKMSKEAAQYQNSPKGNQRCADCRFFIEGGSCRLVEGEISPDGWCTLFQPKA